jgi:predicted metalloprotease with PDZ domain
MSSRVLRARACAGTLLLAAGGVFAQATSSSAKMEMTLDVDATRAPMGIIHARIAMPAKAGPLTLLYPKWIPGEHSPSGPIADLTGLHFFAGGKELEWRRDLVEMYAFHIAIPPGAGTLEVRLDYVMPAPGGEAGATPSADATTAVLNWYTVVLAPADLGPNDIEVRASLTPPSGWKDGGALDVERRTGGTIHYAATPLNVLIDNPVAFGVHYRRIELWPAGSPMGEHVVDAFADSAWALDIPEQRIDAWRRMVKETRALFGGVGHYRKYHWLLTLSDHLGRFGVEHHECSDDRVAEDTMVNDHAARRASALLSHEFFHSWNGKTRRPAGLVNGGYERPMKDDLLWVYEGLTTYYGQLLAARSGLISAADWRDLMAANVFQVSGPGRTWRPLQDTADAAPFLYARTEGWQGWRRGTDFYPEGALIWLEADVMIRQLTAGKRSLDDFCALFFGERDNGRVYLKPYEAADVFAALSRVAPFDWKDFFAARLQAKTAGPPLAGVVDGGYTLAYDAQPNTFLIRDVARFRNDVAAQESLGVHVLEDGTVVDCWPGSKAWDAGIAPGMKLVAVDGRAYSHDRLVRAIGDSPSTAGPIELTVDAAGFVKTCRVEYHGGTKIPHLERVAGRPDVLSAIAAPRANGSR